MRKKRTRRRLWKSIQDRLSGFTLIELLVAIAIIGILSSVVFASVQDARMSAIDANKKSDFIQIRNAITLFYAKYGRMPKNYNCNGFYCAAGNGNFGACDGPVPDVPGTDGLNLVPEAFAASMQELVTAGLLSSVPQSKGGIGYCYFDFGPGNNGAIIMTALGKGPFSVNGIPPSCRPWTSVGATWCEQKSSMEYCLCNPY